MIHTMVVTATEIEEKLGRFVRERLAGASGIRDLQRLPAGATQETWSFEALFGDVPRRLILRRRQTRLPETGALGQCSLELEAKLIELVGRHGGDG